MTPPLPPHVQAYVDELFASPPPPLTEQAKRAIRLLAPCAAQAPAEPRAA